MISLEVSDSVFQGVAKVQVDQPFFFNQAVAGIDQVSVGSAMSGVVAGDRVRSVFVGPNQSDNKGEHVATLRGKIHGNIQGMV